MNPTHDRLPATAAPHSADMFGSSAHTPVDPNPRRGSLRPVPPGVEYHRVLTDDKRRIGRGIGAIVLLVAGMFVAGLAFSQAAAAIDAQLGRTNPAMGGSQYTPVYHGMTMFSLGLLIPWSMLIQRWLYGVKGASLHSVISRFRSTSSAGHYCSSAPSGSSPSSL